PLANALQLRSTSPSPEGGGSVRRAKRRASRGGVSRIWSQQQSDARLQRTSGLCEVNPILSRLRTRYNCAPLHPPLEGEGRFAERSDSEPGWGEPHMVSATIRRAAAKKLRANATPHERMLWRALRELPAAGTHFRRQAPIGPYVVDFLCPAGRLIIE